MSDDDLAELNSYGEGEDGGIFSLTKLEYQSPATANGILNNCIRLFRFLKAELS